MVYSVFYYATEAITRAIVGLALRVAEALRKRPVVEERRVEEEIVYAGTAWGFTRVSNYALGPEYVFVGRATRLRISIPELVPMNIEHRQVRAQPERLFFTFTEAASKDWFKTIEWLAEQLERGEKERGK